MVVPAAILAAPAIGGALGAYLGGYSGAAASSYGLAFLGGGSLATGGLGMAGGTAVVSVVGGGLGGVSDDFANIAIERCGVATLLPKWVRPAVHHSASKSIRTLNSVTVPSESSTPVTRILGASTPTLRDAR